MNYSKLAVIITLFFSLLANAGTISPKLPENALDFLKMHFTQHSISEIEAGAAPNGLYRVTLSDGTSVLFDDRGNWKGINGNYRALPKTVLPKAISSHVKKNFNSPILVKADKKSWGYKVRLMDGTALEYNNSGKFLRIDK